MAFIRQVIIAFILFALGIQAMSAQDMITANDNKVIPPSPSSAVFRKYMGEQPSLATGSVNVTIPLYELSCHGLTIPFSLRYNTSGIKVFDDPNPCGFGWALLPGMRIMRTIMGRPDEMFEFVGDEQNLGSDFSRVQRCMTDSGAMSSNPELLDAQHDIFTVSLLHGNYTYILDKRNGLMQFVGVGSAELKIVADSQLNQINVTDSHGIEYVFGNAYELVENLYKSAWMLTRINLPNGEHISMEWFEGHHTHPRHQVLGGDNFCDSYDGHHPQHVSPGEVESSAYSGNRICTSPYYLHQHLEKVTFPGGTIELSYRGNGSGPALESFVVKNTTETVKTVTFEYGGAERPESYLLKRVRFSDEGDYVFEYNPNRFGYTHALDYWGYYSGRTNGQSSLVPQMRIKEYDGNISTYYVNIGHADRSIDPEKMQANILTSVTYPTGGRTEFEYEPHRFNDPTPFLSTEVDPAYNQRLTEGGGLRLTRMTTRTSAQDTNPVVKRYVYGENENGLAECVATPIPETFVSTYQSVNLDQTNETIYPKEEYWFRRVDVGISSNYMDHDIGQSPIWYKQVTEYTSEGKTIHRFEDKLQRNQFANEFGKRMLQQLNKAFSKGPMKVEESIYKSEGSSYRLVKKLAWDYSVIRANTQTAYTSTAIHRNIRQVYLEDRDLNSPDFNRHGYASVPVTRLVYNAFFEQPQYVYTDKYSTYSLCRYHIDISTERLRSHSTTIYTDNGEHIATTNLSYLDDTNIVCSKTDDNGTLRLYYPHTIGQRNDLTDGTTGQSSVLAEMESLNMLGVPVYTTLTYNGDSIAARNLFAHYGNRLYLPYRVMTRRGNGEALNLGTYSYNSAGNLVSRTLPDGVTEEYQWGYINRYPVRYTLGGNHVSTYQYKPLVGMTSAADPRGVISTYTYDSHNRLTQISQNGNILQRYAYHMQGESTNAQSLTPWDGNYIYERTYLNASGTNNIDKVNHFDALGRPIQTVAIDAGGDNSDIAVTTEYDDMNRPVKVWQPVPVNSGGDIVPISAIESAAQATYGDSYAYAMTDYEASPRELAVSSTKEGHQWHENGKSATFRQLTNDNTSKYSCRKYGITAGGGLTLSGNYAPGELTVAETTDEDGKTTIEFTDRRGHKVLSRRIADESACADCYYVYDNYGDLRYVIPPMLVSKLKTNGATWSITDSDIDKFGYYYRYNNAGLCVYRKLPGRDAVISKYDSGRRLVAEQDGNMRNTGTWLTHFYDRYGREVVSGMMSASEDEINTLLGDPIVASRNYSDECYGYAFSRMLPTEIYPMVKVNYYDDYGFINYTRDSNPGKFGCETMTVVNSAAEIVSDSHTLPATGLLTGSISFQAGAGNGYLSVYYYDARGNLRETHSRNSRGGTDHEITTYSYTNQPLTSIRRHYDADGDSIVQRYDYTYDHADRQKTVSHRLNSGAQALLSHSAYNSIGRQSAITTGLISTNYQYDVHGWLSGISNSRFSQTLQYADGAAPCYNGNISSNLWQDNQGTVRRYDYSYDGLNRLVNAAYTETRQSLPQGLAISGTPDYSAMYEYDLNGNATFIRRNGISRKTGNSSAQTWTYDVIDNIYIEYDGNQPLFIDDTENPLLYENAPGCNDSSFEAEEFAWDANGNMTQDLTKGITSITYNMLNLPSVITYDDGHKEYRYYDTDGNRLRTLYQVAITPASSSASAYARYRTEQTRHYCGDVEYVNDSVARVLTPVGYVNARGNNAATLSDYRFYVRDYQGNSRVLTDYSGNAIERYDYYPYGGLFGEVNPEQWRLYGGKELQTMNGLNLYDFHARWQDYATCWFTTQDPLAEKYYALSPYTYCAGNPIMLIDPTGKDAQITIEGNIITVTANIILKGDNATKELAQIYQKDIMSKWGSIEAVKYKDVTYNVKWDVNVRVMDQGEIEDFNGTNNYLTVIGDKTSYVKNSNEGEIRSEGRNGRSLESDCPMSHEFGHMLGISDKYVTKHDSDMYGQPISSKWAGDIMAEPTFNTVKITNGTLTILFKGVLDKHLNPLRVIYRYMFNKSQTIEYRNQNNREKKK